MKQTGLATNWQCVSQVSAEMKQYMLVMYNNVTETADEAMNNIACEI
ncbi:MAG: hypothetical protein IKN04_10565 [Clostridia bacterium]|nr:hypothetical protein [Clostridia bacterium]